MKLESLLRRLVFELRRATPGPQGQDQADIDGAIELAEGWLTEVGESGKEN